ncbi:MAG: nucleoside-diphosphate kinase [Phycisphaerae bacterium]|nr:nucleoside-diphosphate kinase [Phycisphaerae bacterium]
MERTLVIVKPDAVQRHLIGRILHRLERKGLKIVALRMRPMDESLARKMYAEHQGKDFYEPLVAFVTAGAVVAMVVEGYDVISIVRSMVGSTFGPDAAPGTIRGDFGASRRYNLIHASDSPESARREIDLWFDDEDILEYEFLDDPWIYAAVDRE